MTVAIMAKALNFERAIVSINNFNSNCLRGLEHSYERLKASASSYLQLPNVGNRNQHFLRAASSAPTSAINHRPQTLASIDPFEPFSLSPSFVVLSRKTSHSPLTKIWNLWTVPRDESGIGAPSFVQLQVHFDACSGLVLRQASCWASSFREALLPSV